METRLRSAVGLVSFSVAPPTGGSENAVGLWSKRTLWKSLEAIRLVPWSGAAPLPLWILAKAGHRTMVLLVPVPDYNGSTRKKINGA